MDPTKVFSVLITIALLFAITTIIATFVHYELFRRFDTSIANNEVYGVDVEDEQQQHSFSSSNNFIRMLDLRYNDEKLGEYYFLPKDVDTTTAINGVDDDDNAKNRDNDDDDNDADSHRYNGIYIDFIYNPNYYFELSVVKHMLMEIIDNNPNMGYYYDYESKPTSTIISVGYEHFGYKFQHKTVLLLKPKLLKDILYNDDIFKRTYVFLMSFFRFQLGSIDPTMVPEYDRNISFKRYRALFDSTLRRIDESNRDKIVCRNDELYHIYSGRLCIVVDDQYINSLTFAHQRTKRYWIETLNKISIFMGHMLNETFHVNVLSYNSDSCYKIRLRIEPQIRNVLLFSHKAVKTFRTDERIDDNDVDGIRQRTLESIILFKHRILHSLGMGHRYWKPSVMRFYDYSFQRNNAFFIMPEDYESLSKCYGSPTERVHTPYMIHGASFSSNVEISEKFSRKNRRRYVKSYDTDEKTRRYLDKFLNNFASFKSEYYNEL